MLLMMLLWARDETKKPPTLLSSSLLHRRPARIASHRISRPASLAPSLRYMWR